MRPPSDLVSVFSPFASSINTTLLLQSIEKQPHVISIAACPVLKHVCRQSWPTRFRYRKATTDAFCDLQMPYGLDSDVTGNHPIGWPRAKSKFVSFLALPVRPPTRTSSICAVFHAFVSHLDKTALLSMYFVSPPLMSKSNGRPRITQSSFLSVAEAASDVLIIARLLQSIYNLKHIKV
jgi:hypothetical protein